MGIKEELIDEIETFRQVRGMAVSTFGREAVSDPNFLERLANSDRAITSHTIDTIRTFMKHYGDKKYYRRIQEEPKLL